MTPVAYRMALVAHREKESEQQQQHRTFIPRTRRGVECSIGKKGIACQRGDIRGVGFVASVTSDASSCRARLRGWRRAMPA